jgi:hypothetical protein
MALNCWPFVQNVGPFKLLRATMFVKQNLGVSQEALEIVGVHVWCAGGSATTVVDSSSSEPK